MITSDMHKFLDKVDASPLSKERKDWYYKQITILSNDKSVDQLIFSKMISLSTSLKEESSQVEMIRKDKTLKGLIKRAKLALNR